MSKITINIFLDFIWKLLKVAFILCLYNKKTNFKFYKFYVMWRNPGILITKNRRCVKFMKYSDKIYIRVYKIKICFANIAGA